MDAWMRYGAWSGVAGGLGLAGPSAVEAVTGETAATSFVLALAPALAVPLLVVLHRRQAEATGTFGALAYTLNLVGLGLFGGAAFALNMVVFYLDEAVVEHLLAGPARAGLLGSALVFAVGTVLFGVTMLRAKVHPRPPAIGYLVALPVLAVAARLPDTPLTSALHIAAGLSLVWLAISLVSPDRVPTGSRPA
jgi:hypothetical protein